MTKTNKMVPMVNIWDKDVTIHIGGSPGEGVTEYTIKPGDAESFPEGYCTPVKGAGSTDLPPILARESTRTWEDGVRRPTLVPKAEADKAAKDARAAVEAWKKRPKPTQLESATAR